MTTSYVECLQALQNQTYTTPEQKVACLKVLKVFTKNLLDPVKAKDEKYRQVRLDNCKIQQTLVPCNPAAVEYLHSLGFTPAAASSDDQVLRMETMIDAEVMAAALTAVQQALETLGVKANNPPTTLQHQPSSSSTLSSTSSTTTTTTNSTERLTEKQKARRLLEAQRQAELAQAKQNRKKTAALLQQDKYVRAKDENWTSGPSAAVHKAGNAIPTFRDRHGE